MEIERGRSVRIARAQKLLDTVSWPLRVERACDTLNSIVSGRAAHQLRSGVANSCRWLPGRLRIAGSSTWAGNTISGLGLTPGSYKWTWGTTAAGNADSLTLNIGQVPDPGTLTLLGIGVAGIAGGTWLRRKRVFNKVPA